MIFFEGRKTNSGSIHDICLKKRCISIRKDFWKNETVPFDLVAKVIYAVNEGDIIGQCIIFCHVLNEQIKHHGRTTTAVSETIRICKDRNVLKEYLESREKEVINIMITLFDQEYAMKAYLKEERKIGEIKGIVSTCQDFGASKQEVIKKSPPSSIFQKKMRRNM